MTPQEKAKILVAKFIRYVPAEEELELPYAKQCAIIAVDEILNAITKQDSSHVWNFWQSVRTEISKL